MEYVVIAFESTHSAMTCKKYLSAIFPLTVMPTPRSISSACGISLRLKKEHLQALKDTMTNIGLDTSEYNIYVIDEQGKPQRQ